MKEEIIIVLIINNHFVRWESIDVNASFRDFYKMITSKYVIPMEIIFEVNDESILSRSKEKLKKYCKHKDYFLTIRLFTRGNLSKLEDVDIID
jgi:hypothetical protein